MSRAAVMISGLAVLLLPVSCTNRSDNANPPAVAPTAVDARRGEADQRGYTGILIRGSASFGPGGTIIPNFPVVRDVIDGSPAEKAGLAAGDVILEINGIDARSDNAPPLITRDVNSIIVLRIKRGQVEREVTVVAEPRPQDANP